MAAAYRAREAGAFRSLNEREYFAFLQAIRNMPWSLREKA